MNCVLILHNIRSVLNVGAIFRTADAVGVSKICLTGYTPAPLDRFGRPRSDLHKVALGAENLVPWEIYENINKLIHDLQLKKYEVLALEQDSRAIDYKKCTPTKNFALVVGNEVEGTPKEIFDLCDQIIEIPMRGKKESLNVSVATGIALFRLLDP
ncbi:MAG TPA: TrmH family RNA methyltransferase [Candidatus Paceibacterota bacterium]